METTRNDQQISIIERPLDFVALKKSEIYTKKECAWFHSKRDPFWELSNMAGGMTLSFKKTKWNSSEQLYQASKYSPTVNCLPHSSMAKPNAMPNVRTRITQQKNSRGAKMTQKCAVKAGLVRSDWESPDYEVRICSMLWVLELKLFHHRGTFGKTLKATGTLPIVEMSKKDDFWGCKIKDDGRLEGRNVLGKLLMLLRERYDEVTDGKFMYPDGFLLKEER